MSEALFDLTGRVAIVTGTSRGLGPVVGQERPVELHAQLAGVVVPHGVAHGHHRRDAAPEQGVGRPGVAGPLGAGRNGVGGRAVP